MQLTVFLVLPRKLHPALFLALKTVIPRDHLIISLLPRLSFRGMHDKPSVFSSRYLGRNGCYLVDCGPCTFYSSIVSCLSPHFVAGITLRPLANRSRGITAKERLFVWF